MLGVRLLKSTSQNYNVSNLVKDVTWSGDINTMARTADITLSTAADLDKDVLIEFEVGNMILLYEDNVEFFRGYIFRKGIDSDGQVTLTCFDQLIYLSNNSHTILIKNKSASDIIVSMLKKFNLKIGSIESTNHKIKQLYLDSKSLSDIFTESLVETKKYTKKSYRIYSEKGLVYMKSREKASKSTLGITDVISASRETSIEDLRTQVMVEKGSMEAKKDETKYKSHVVKNEKMIEKYGIMQHVESADDKASLDTMKKQASSLLDQLSKPSETISIEFLGKIDCITGNRISVKNEIANILGEYYITSDSHNFSGGVHKMTLQFSNKLE